jgi:DNA mismatch repair protein MutL
MPHFRAKPSKSLGTDAIPPPLQAEVEHYPQPPLCPVIRALEPHLINQIAAGEVVERPAAALKELMENALDAGASRLTLQWRQGGQSLLSVQDNGCGMAPQDLLLALQRHTTSKLPDGDLWAISSFGFRGEALAAIASTARITITSRPSHLSDGWRVQIESGTIIDQRPIAAPPGTTVEVRDLFYSTPARLKFLRSPNVEQSALIEGVDRMAVMFHNVEISVCADGRPRNYPLGEQARLASVLGKRFVENSGPVIHQDDGLGYSLTGHISVPTHHRSASDMQFLFVNGRSVKDRLLSHCLKVAFQDVIPHGRHSVCVLYLTLPTLDVDVNVHPCKTEVRFRDPAFVRGFVLMGLRRALMGSSLRAASLDGLDRPIAGGWNQSTGSPAQNQPQGPCAFEKNQPESFNTPSVLPLITHPFEPMDSGQKRHFADRPVGRFSSSCAPAPSQNVGHFAPKNHQETPIQDQTFQQMAASPTIDLFSAQAKSQTPAEQMQAEQTPAATNVDLGNALAQIHNAYILAENAQGLVLIDPHAAHERITYEALKSQWKTSVGAVEQLLVTSALDLTPADSDLLHHHQAALKTLGLTCLYTNQTWQVTSRPMVFSAHDPACLVQDALALLRQMPEPDTHDLQTLVLRWRDQIMANWACRQSLRLGTALSMPEMQALLRTLERTPNSAQCNHGRPVYRQLSKAQLGNLFERH